MPISELVTIIMGIWVGKWNKLKTDLCLRMTKVRGKLGKSFPKRKSRVCMSEKVEVDVEEGSDKSPLRLKSRIG